MEGKIYVITHKKIKVPMIETLNEYEIIQTGDNKAPNLGYLKTSSRDNIADYNDYYADLTVHYWVWKNINYDYVGINHYCRYLFYRGHIISGSEVEELLKEYDILLPSKYVMPINVRQQFNGCHTARDMDLAHDIMIKLYPNYEQSFNIVMNSTAFHICNIMIAKKSVFNAYCEWIFPILERVRNSIDLNEYVDSYHKRVGGFLSERLFNVWLVNNRIPSYELNFIVLPKNMFDIV